MFLLQDLTGLEDEASNVVNEAFSKGMNFRWLDEVGVVEMLLRFGFFMLVLWFIVHFLYYRKTHRRDYFFTLVLLSVSIFFLIYLLGSVKDRAGGLWAGADREPGRECKGGPRGQGEEGGRKQK